MRACLRRRSCSTRCSTSSIVMGLVFRLNFDTPNVPGYSISQRAHKPQGIEIAREISRACMLLDALVFLFYRSPVTPFAPP